ncbi:MAG: esterase family protein, partial [Alteromonadales bacterium]|nr:esterase family protein [Alteromonadales bacterium]
MIVVLPPSYHTEPNKQYPVVYLLHGLGAKAEGWFSTVEGEPNIEVALQRLYNEQQISEMIVVVPNSYNEFALGGWYSNSASGGNWEDYIIKDVIPYIDKNYRTDTEQRGLAGGSMGGYGAFRLAMKHPKMFEAIYALSAAFADSS